MNIDELLRKLVPNLDNKFWSRRSILDYPGDPLVYVNNNSIMIVLPRNNPPKDCLANQSCSGQDNIFWSNKMVILTFCDKSCERLDFSYLLTTQIYSEVKSKYELIGESTTLISPFFGLRNLFFPIFQGGCSGVNVKTLCPPYGLDNEFARISFPTFITSLKSYLQRSAIPYSLRDLDFYRNNIDQDGDYVPTCEPVCLDQPIAYLTVDNDIISIIEFEDKLSLQDLSSQEFFDTVIDDPDYPGYLDIQIASIPKYNLFRVDYDIPNYSQDYYNCQDQLCVDTLDPLTGKVQLSCCVDSQISVLVINSCEEISCENLIPGWYFKLSDFEPQRFANPTSILTDALIFAAAIAITVKVPRVTILYNPLEGNITVSLAGVELPLEFFECPCPVGTKWNSNLQTCCNND